MRAMTKIAPRAAALSVVFIATAASAQQVDLLPEPGMPNPKFQFQTGKVVANKPEISSVAPAIPGATSAWRIGQWHKSEYLAPTEMKSPRSDLFVWDTPNGNSRVQAQKVSGKWVYQLVSRNGALTPSGGANVFLTADATANATLDRPITLSFDGRLSESSVSYSNPAARENGAVLAQVFAGFWLHFKRPSTGEVMPVALQVEYARSQDRRVDYRACALRPNGPPRIVFGRSLPGEARFAFGQDGQRVQSIKTDINRYLCDLIAQDLQCRGKGQRQQFGWDAEARDLRNWTLKSVYIGVETQNQDERSGSTNASPQGQVTAGLELSGLRLTEDPSGNFSCNHATR